MAAKWLLVGAERGRCQGSALAGRSNRRTSLLTDPPEVCRLYWTRLYDASRKALGIWLQGAGEGLVSDRLSKEGQLTRERTGSRTGRRCSRPASTLEVTSGSRGRWRRRRSPCRAGRRCESCSSDGRGQPGKGTASEGDARRTSSVGGPTWSRMWVDVIRDDNAGALGSDHSRYFSPIQARIPTGLSNSAWPIVPGLVP